MKSRRRSHWAVLGNPVSKTWQIQLAKPSRCGYDMVLPTPQNSGFKTKREAAERKRWLDTNHPARYVGA